MSINKDSFTGTLELMKLALRRDRIMIPLFIGFFVLLIVGYAAIFVNLYSNAMIREAYYLLGQNTPSIIALFGSIPNSSIGGLTAWRSGVVGAFLIGLISIFLMVRHTRSEERRGRLEFLDSTSVGRQAPLTAALLTTFIVDIIISIFTTLGFIGFGLDATSSLVFALSMGVFGLLFASITAVAVQLTESSSDARYLSVGLLVGLYILRIIGWDNGSYTWLSWLSPYGWVHSIKAFAGNDLWVFGLFIIFIVGLTILAYYLNSIRDVGSGIIPQRPGPASASKSLSSSLALAWRLQRGMLLFWMVILALFGSVIGFVAQSATSLLSSNPQLLKPLIHAGYVAPVDSFFALSLGLFSIAFAVYTILATSTLQTEESKRYSEMLLTNSVSRSRWMISNLIFGVLGPTLLIIIFSIIMGLSYDYSSGLSYNVTRLVEASLLYLPAIWILTGISALLFGLYPRLTSLSWVALGLFLIVDLVGEFSNISQWILNLSPFTQVPNYLIGGTLSSSWGWIFVVAAILMLIGVYSYNQRDING